MPTAKLSALLLVLAFLAVASPAQEPDPPPEAPAPNSAAQQLGRALTTVHGIVRNAATGEPLPRALVLFGGDAGEGVLTDGDGRFEISGVPLGPNPFQVTRPGFQDTGNSPSSVGVWAKNGYTHEVFVSDETPEVNVALQPTNVIHGHVDLSTGDPAQNIQLVLYERAIQDGRAVWRPANRTRTNSDGNYRFAGLGDGYFVVSTEPAMDSDIYGSLPASGNSNRIAMNGYPAVYYPDARQFSGAGRIQLAGGSQAQANFILTQEPFHSVHASVLFPAAIHAPTGRVVMASFLDTDGQAGSYPAMFESPNSSIQAYLPDGAYTLRVTALHPGTFHADGPAGPRSRMNVMAFTGQVDLTVAGRPLTGIRIPLANTAANTLQVAVVHNATQAAGSNTQGNGIYVSVSPAAPGGRTEAMMSELAHGPVPDTLDLIPLDPGAYWVHTSIQQQGLCEGSFTAGGANLGREPLVVNQGGATAPLSLTLRDDCASLRLSLPSSLATLQPGEETALTVYVVPDFDSTVDVHPVVLRASSGTSTTLTNLTPGNYHVYTFTAPVELEYHNPESLSRLPNPGRAISLSPGATTDFVVETPEP